MVSVTAKDENFRNEVQNGNIWKIVFRVCVPLAIYSWISQLFSVLDTLMASRISSEAVSTVVYMVQLQHIVLSVGQGLSVGGGIMIAHALSYSLSPHYCGHSFHSFPAAPERHT